MRATKDATPVVSCPAGTMELRTEHGSSRALLLTTLSSAWAHSQLLPLRIGATAGMSGKISRSSVSHKDNRSEEHTSELQSLMRISYAVFCLKKKKSSQLHNIHQHLL